MIELLVKLMDADGPCWLPVVVILKVKRVQWLHIDYVYFICIIFLFLHIYIYMILFVMTIMIFLVVMLVPMPNIAYIAGSDAHAGQEEDVWWYIFVSTGGWSKGHVYMVQRSLAAGCPCLPLPRQPLPQLLWQAQADQAVVVELSMVLWSSLVSFWGIELLW